MPFAFFSIRQKINSSMSTTSEAFFNKEENQAILRRFALALQSAPSPGHSTLDVIPYLRQFFKILIANTSAFDQYCTVNIEWIGQQFIDGISNFNETKSEDRQESLASIFVSAYRFICELEFSQSGDLSFELRSIKGFVADNLENFSVSDRQQLVYANYIMPAQITKKLINSPALVEFKKFAETAKAAEDLKIVWDRELKEKNEEITVLRAGISRAVTAYNFVGLVKGFESLANVKEKEQRHSFISLLALGIVMVLPILTQLWFTVSRIDTVDSHRNTLIYLLPSFITLEVIFLYFFRIVLSNYRSVSTQLLQIDLRISLCQFIQNYAEYSTKIKKQDASALEKFENLIFSGIAMDGAILPSTFDGIEQIAKLVNSVRGK